MSISLSQLEQTYAHSDDPWEFRTSAYEQAKFAATRDALTRGRYGAALELGCGNGALARHLAPLCGCYTGLDAVERALTAARQAVPDARFCRGWLPDDLPQDHVDLIVLSEILYFLDRAGLERLAGRIATRWPAAELICVTWLGDTGHPLQGRDALDIFNRALPPRRRLAFVTGTDRYRIDRHSPEPRP